MCNEKCKNYCVNDGPKLVVIIIWVLGNIAAFAERFYAYQNPDEGSVRVHFKVVLGTTLPLARASAAVIKLNCALILFFVLRNFLSWLRGTFIGSYFPVDKNIIFHKFIGFTILIFASIHICAHFINFYRFSTHDTNDPSYIALGLVPPGAENPTIGYFSFRTIAGGTGHAVVFCMLLMYTTALQRVRGPLFEIFWYSHHLFIPFYLLLMFHGYAAILEPPTFWMWTIGPVVLYLIERLVRLLRSKQDCIITEAIGHPSNVLELRFKKTSFKYKCGQYVFLCSPYIANYEWHPFTISSSPDEDFVSVHIRRAGDWTGSVHDLLNEQKDIGVVQENVVNAPNGTPILLIDGPFGAASEDVFEFENVLLFAAGIGVTPFASIIKSIRYRINETDEETSLKSVEFYWINREKRSFEWFIDLLAELENTCSFLKIHLYFTGKDEGERGDRNMGLNSKTTYGRPDLDAIFTEKAAEYQGNRVGVFFCGPPVISKGLYKQCRKKTDISTNTRFIYHKENF